MGQSLTSKALQLQSRCSQHEQQVNQHFVTVKPLTGPSNHWEALINHGLIVVVFDLWTEKLIKSIALKNIFLIYQHFRGGVVGWQLCNSG